MHTVAVDVSGAAKDAQRDVRANRDAQRAVRRVKLQVVVANGSGNFTGLPANPAVGFAESLH